MKYAEISDYYVMRDMILLRQYFTPAERIKRHQRTLDWKQTPTGKRVIRRIIEFDR